MLIFADLAKVLNLSMVYLSGLQSRFELPTFDGAGYSDAYRHGNGKFWNLGDPEDMPADSFEGRFACLLPPKRFDDKTRQMGKALLESMGVEVMQLDSTKSSLWAIHRMLVGGRKFDRLCSPKISSVFRHGRCFSETVTYVLR